MEKKFSKFVYDKLCTYKHAKGTKATPSKEFHNYHEIILFIGGKTTFLSEEKRIPLSPYQTIIIPKETYHQFINECDEEYHRCCFGFFDTPQFDALIKKCMYAPRVIEASSEQKMLFKKMNEIVDSSCSKKEKQILMHALLALILNETSRACPAVKEGCNFSEITVKLIEKINENIMNKLSIPELSKELNVSVSTLSQTFRKDMNISIYQYILRKKLMVARQKIEEGEPATSAALQCGFSDYSGFYKQYKKMFGTSPSQKSERFFE